MKDSDFISSCPSCDRRVVISVSSPLQRGRCGPCRTVYTIGNRIDGSPYLVSVQSPTIEVARGREERIRTVGQWIRFFGIIMSIGCASVFGLTYLPDAVQGLCLCLIPMAVVGFIFYGDRGSAAERKRLRWRRETVPAENPARRSQPGLEETSTGIGSGSRDHPRRSSVSESRRQRRLRKFGEEYTTLNLVVFGCVLFPFVFVAMRAILWLWTH